MIVSIKIQDYHQLPFKNLKHSSLKNFINFYIEPLTKIFNNPIKFFKDNTTIGYTNNVYVDSYKYSDISKDVIKNHTIKLFFLMCNSSKTSRKRVVELTFKKDPNLVISKKIQIYPIPKKYLYKSS